MALWNIQESETVKEQLEYYRADKAVTRNYLQFIKELARSGNPASMGNPKKKAGTTALLAGGLQSLSALFTVSTTQPAGLTW